MSVIAWQHVTPDPSHPAEPHYAGSGWVCFVCREPVNDAGRKVNMTALRTPALVADPDLPGLQNEGA